MLAVYAAVELLHLENFGVLAVCCAISGIIWIAAGFIYRRLTPEGEREYQNLLAFRKYLTDFTAIGERAPREVHLWQDYLIYATLMDCAPEVRKSLPFPGTEVKESSASGAAAPDMSGSGHFSGGHRWRSTGSSFRAFFSFGDSMSRTFESVRGTASKQAHPSGGGSSGGGGGAGSGGGGGVR